MKGHFISVKNDLLEAKHIENMGPSPLWLYLWFLDKMTKIDQESEEGKVLGGKPICFEDVAILGISQSTYKRWVNTLRKSGYIETLRTPKGLVITVNKAFKVFGQQTYKGKGQYRPIARSDVSYRRVRSDPSNIRQDIDKTKTISEIINKEDFRGKFSPAKEKLREQLKRK
jgi:hypothetical protein